ncbi:MAG: DUF3089 domain-containing protein [Anaerovoracaceae bacterium]
MSERTNYADEYCWLNISKNITKDVDVFYLYPTAWSRKNKEEPATASISNPNMRRNAKRVFEAHSMVFSECCNIFAPYYRQLDPGFGLGGDKKLIQEVKEKITGRDVIDSFDYYINNFNEGRPYILAGHSQGSSLLLRLLETYLKEHKEIYSKMIAAYVVGYSVTSEFLHKNPHLKFAKNAYDTGVLVSYNTEAEFFNGKTPIVHDNALTINPLNWRRDDEEATSQENLGELMLNGQGKYVVKIPGTKDAIINKERGTLMCSTADATKYKHKWFPLGVYHTYDYEFYYGNLKKNVKDRVNSFMEEKKK